MLTASGSEGFSLEDFMANPPEQMEWVDGRLVEKTGMTPKPPRIQSIMNRYWGNCATGSGQGGEVYIELRCRTKEPGRRPDASYLTAELLQQFGDAPAWPQSPPLIAEIASPNDSADDFLAKVDEYLESGCEGVWLVFPESRRGLIIPKNQSQ